jgi:hypothetical protein
VAASRFEFVASGDTQPPAKPLAVHNGGTARLTDVRLTRLAYADSARGAAWLVVLPRQSAVAPDELATVGTLCVDAAGLPAGTYRATAAVGAREVPEPVAITITLVVTDAGAARATRPRAAEPPLRSSPSTREPRVRRRHDADRADGRRGPRPASAASLRAPRRSCSACARSAQPPTVGEGR